VVKAATLAGVIVTAVPLFAAAQSEDTEGRFDRFKQQQRQILDALVVPFEQCVRRQDTYHVAFHG
jgi:hypothetical protein